MIAPLSLIGFLILVAAAKPAAQDCTYIVRATTPLPFVVGSEVQFKTSANLYRKDFFAAVGIDGKPKIEAGKPFRAVPAGEWQTGLLIGEIRDRSRAEVVILGVELQSVPKFSLHIVPSDLITFVDQGQPPLIPHQRWQKGKPSCSPWSALGCLEAMHLSGQIELSPWFSTPQKITDLFQKLERAFSQDYNLQAALREGADLVENAARQRLQRQKELQEFGVSLQATRDVGAVITHIRGGGFALLDLWVEIWRASAHPIYTEKSGLAARPSRYLATASQVLDQLRAMDRSGPEYYPAQDIPIADIRKIFARGLSISRQIAGHHVLAIGVVPSGSYKNYIIISDSASGIFKIAAPSEVKDALQVAHLASVAADAPRTDGDAKVP